MSRLPTNCVPQFYKIIYDSIDLDDEFKFFGREEVDLDIVEADCNCITMHALNLDVSEVYFVKDGIRTNSNKIDVDVANQMIRLFFPSPLPQGSATLSLRFAGTLNTQLAGLYKGTYIMDGKPRYLAVTQFEPTDARRAFPAWDEPSFKAKFQLTITAPADRVVISNTPVQCCNLLPVDPAARNRRCWTFEVTPKMSTYLVAFCVGDFDYVAGWGAKEAEGIQVAVYTPPGRAEEGGFALDVASKALAEYTRHFGIAYPLPKLDLLAIPNFAMGAMENWGCVTYRETRLLINPDRASNALRRATARTICHEIAHQWFGNLATMEWWTDLWLNEGFARFMEFLAVDAIFPEWKIWLEFVNDIRSAALELDALKSSHAVEVEVSHPDEINSVFDTISYAKGATVIRMLSSFLGEDAFMGGLRLYLSRHKYSNARTRALWEALEEVSKKPVKDIMSAWTGRVGYPVLNFTQGKDGRIHCEQLRFLTTGVVPCESWPVPVVARLVGPRDCNEAQETFSFIYRGGECPDMDRLCELMANPPAGCAVKVDPGSFGAYRVNYPEKQWHALAHVMNTLSVNDTALGAPDRVGLMSDLFAFSAATLVRTDLVLTVLRTCHTRLVSDAARVLSAGKHVCTAGREDVSIAEAQACLSVWKQVHEGLVTLAEEFVGEPFFEQFQSYMESIYSPLHNEAGWDTTDSGNAALNVVCEDLRRIAISGLGFAGHAQTICEASSRVLDYARNPCTGRLPAGLRPALVRISLAALRRGVVSEPAPPTGPPEEVDPSTADVDALLLRGQECLDAAGLGTEDESARALRLGIFAGLLRSYRERKVSEEERNTILGCLGRIVDYAPFNHLLALGLSDDILTQNMHTWALSVGKNPRYRRTGLDFFKTKYSAFYEKCLGAGTLWGHVVRLLTGNFHDATVASEMEAFFAEHAPGSAARSLSQALERVRARSARLQADRESLPGWLS